jgi:hypothetical protein
MDAGIVVTKENKRDIDKVIHGIAGINYKNCSATWKHLKKRLNEDKESFISDLKEALNKSQQKEVIAN